MIYFLDTSVLIKRYVTEKGSDQVRRLLRRDVDIAVARITEAEAYAAIARAVRMNVFTPAFDEKGLDRLWRQYCSVTVDGRLVHALVGSGGCRSGEP